MDGVVVIGGVVLFLVVGPWVFVWWANGARKRDREEDQERSRELASRISVLERSVQKLQVHLLSEAVQLRPADTVMAEQLAWALIEVRHYGDALARLETVSYEAQVRPEKAIIRAVYPLADTGTRAGSE